MIPSAKNNLFERRELKTLAETVAQAAVDRSGRILLISGPAGIGKTTLLVQLRRTLALRSLYPLSLEISLSPDISLENIVSSLLRQMRYLRPRENLAEGLSRYQSELMERLLSPSDASFWGQFDPPSPEDLLLLLRRVLSKAAEEEGHGLLIAIDDLHNADLRTLDWLASLGRYLSIDCPPISLVLSCRESPDTSPILKRFESLADDLMENLPSAAPGTHFISLHLRLENFDLSDIASYLEDLLCPGFVSVNPEFVQWLQDQSCGRPYYLRLLLELASEQGILHQHPEIGWTVTADYKNLKLPPTLEEMLWTKVAPALADPLQGPALEYLAALSSPVGYEDWATLVGMAATDLIETLLQLERQGLARDIFLQGEHLVVFVHPLVGELILSRMAPHRLQDLADKTVAYYHERRQYPKALDRLLRLIPTATPPPTLIAESLAVAKRNKDWQTILRWYDALSSGTVRVESGLWLAAIRAAKETAQPQRGLAISSDHPELAGSLTVAERISYYSLRHFCLMESQPDGISQMLDQASAWAEALPRPEADAARKEMDFLLLTYYQSIHEFEKCLELGNRLKSLWGGDRVYRLRIDNTLGLMLLFRGSLAEADAIYRHQIIPFLDLMPPDFQAKAFFNWAKILARLAHYDQAEICYQKARDLCEQERLHDVLLMLRADFAAMRWRQGRHRQALQELEAVHHAAYAGGNLKIQSTVLDSIIGIKGELDEGDGLPELLQRNLRLKESLGNPIGCACSMINLAECSCRGLGTKVDAAAARHWSLRAIETLQKAGSKKFLPEALINLSQACLALKQEEEAISHAQTAVRQAAEASPLVSALAQGCLGQALARINPKEAERLLLEAVEIFERLGNRYEQARHLEALAKCYLERGETTPGLEVATKAMTLYRALKMDHALARLAAEYPTDRTLAGSETALSRSGDHAQIRILTLGPLQIFPGHSTQPLSEGAKKQIARKIVAYVLTQDYTSRHGVARRQLLEEFWGGEHGAGSMRVCLSRLKKAVGRPLLKYVDDRYCFCWDDPGIYLDREQLELLCHQALELERKKDWSGAWSLWEQAESLFRGKYLEDISEPWAETCRQALFIKHILILKKLIEISKSIGKGKQMEFYSKKLSSISNNI